MSLHINHIDKVFEQRQSTPLNVLQNINLTIEEGEFVSLLGPSGCGKSTLLSILSGLEKPTSGDVFLNQEKVKGPSSSKGVVFQQPSLFPWLNVINNIKFPLKRQKHLAPSDQASIAEKYLKMVQLTKFKHHYPHELSGGMQQRIAIARVLAMDPKLLLMDEPFGALDEQTRFVLQKELERIWLQTKKTIVFVTHSIREAITLSDRIIVMGSRPGKIIADIPITLERPRNQVYMAKYEGEIMSLLKGEINKVVREELEDANPI